MNKQALRLIPLPSADLLLTLEGAGTDLSWGAAQPLSASDFSCDKKCPIWSAVNYLALAIAMLLNRQPGLFQISEVTIDVFVMSSWYRAR